MWICGVISCDLFGIDKKVKWFNLFSCVTFRNSVQMNSKKIIFSINDWSLALCIQLDALEGLDLDRRKIVEFSWDGWRAECYSICEEVIEFYLAHADGDFGSIFIKIYLVFVDLFSE